MTRQESAQLEQLRKDLHSYHTEVREEIARCEACRSTVTKHDSDLYGLPGKAGECPGIMARITDLESSRRTLRWGGRAAWGLLLALIGAIGGYLLRQF
jgi:hypothetical protein